MKRLCFHSINLSSLIYDDFCIAIICGRFEKSCCYNGVKGACRAYHHQANRKIPIIAITSASFAAVPRIKPTQVANPAFEA